MALWLDPVSIDLVDEGGEFVEYDLEIDEVIIGDDDCFVEVGGNIEVLICGVDDPDEDFFELNVDDVPETARGGVIYIGTDEETTQSLTEGLREGQTEYRLEF